jgi:hypothetical protein
MWWRFLAWVYALVRPLVVDDLDPNEDFLCCECNRPVLRRVLCCSRACRDAFDARMDEMEVLLREHGARS